MPPTSVQNTRVMKERKPQETRDGEKHRATSPPLHSLSQSEIQALNKKNLATTWDVDDCGSRLAPWQRYNTGHILQKESAEASRIGITSTVEEELIHLTTLVALRRSRIDTLLMEKSLQNFS